MRINLFILFAILLVSSYVIKGHTSKRTSTLKTLFSDADDAVKLEYAGAWKALSKHSQLRKTPANLRLLGEIKGRFSFNGKNGLEGLEEIFKGHGDVTELLANLKRVDPLFGKVPNIRYTGTTSNTRVRIVDNDAIPVREGSKSLKFLNLIKEGNDDYFNEELFNSFEFVFNSVVIKPENIKIGTANKYKIALIGQSMGGGTERLVPGTSRLERMFGVKDYSYSLMSLGYDTKLFLGGERIDVPVLSDVARSQMKQLVDKRAAELGKDPKYVLLEYDKVKTTLGYAENKIWAEYVRDNGYTVIDVGNPNNITDRSAFYDMEREIIFEIKK